MEEYLYHEPEKPRLPLWQHLWLWTIVSILFATCAYYSAWYWTGWQVLAFLICVFGIWCVVTSKNRTRIRRWQEEEIALQKKREVAKKQAMEDQEELREFNQLLNFFIRKSHSSFNSPLDIHVRWVNKEGGRRRDIGSNFRYLTFNKEDHPRAVLAQCSSLMDITWLKGNQFWWLLDWDWTDRKVVLRDYTGEKIIFRYIPYDAEDIEEFEYRIAEIIANTDSVADFILKRKIATEGGDVLWSTKPTVGESDTLMYLRLAMQNGRELWRENGDLTIEEVGRAIITAANK